MFLQLFDTRSLNVDVVSLFINPLHARRALIEQVAKFCVFSQISRLTSDLQTVQDMNNDMEEDSKRLAIASWMLY